MQRPKEGDCPQLVFSLLGPVEIRVPHRSVPVQGILARSVLAALLVQANQIVKLDRIIHALWEEPPRSATPQVRNLVSQLRRTLRELIGGNGSEVLSTRSGGYIMLVSDVQVDVLQAEYYLVRGRASAEANEYRDALICFDRSIALWNGEPLADVTYPLAGMWQPRLVELRRSARLGRAEAMLKLGMSRQAVEDLVGLAAEIPEDEEVRLLLITSLHAGGRSAAALAMCRETRQYFAEHLGITPGVALRELEVSILRQEAVEPTVWRTEYHRPMTRH